MGLRFVKPVTDRIELTGGAWIEVKHQLTVGERRGILSRAAKGGVSTDGQRVHLDGAEMAFARVETWLTDWSARDAQDKPMKLTPAALRALDAESFAEIEAALDAHEEAVDAAKNSPASVANGSSTPLQPVSVSGASSPSASGSDTPTAI